MKKPELDLTRNKCHVCGSPLKRDMIRKKEWCIHFACDIKNIEFSIPFKVEVKK